MAWLERRGERYRIKFRYGGHNFQHTLKTSTEREAQALLGRLEDNLMLVERGKLDVPPSSDLCLFLLSDGKLNHKPLIQKALRLREFFRRYEARETDSKEKSTRYTESIHIHHLERLIGAEFIVRSITMETFQAYIDARAKEVGSGGTVSAATIHKEIGTFAAIWNKWALPLRLVDAPAPTKGLIYPKTKGKQLFQTWQQIERRIARGGLSHHDQDKLWETLFLDAAEMDQVLDHVKAHGKAAWVYPMFVFAARTGARRSEMLRAEIDDFDFEDRVVRLREKKKDQSKELTFRHVPLSPLLSTAMREWFASLRHPGGRLALCQTAGVPLAPAMATYQFARALENSKWKVLRGWHTLRHSFCSNCAAKGIDQRLISSWMGHMTAEMEQRYRHLFPSHEEEALLSVFG